MKTEDVQRKRPVVARVYHQVPAILRDKLKKKYTVTLRLYYYNKLAGTVNSFVYVPAVCKLKTVAVTNILYTRHRETRGVMGLCCRTV